MSLALFRLLQFLIKLCNHINFARVKNFLAIKASSLWRQLKSHARHHPANVNLAFWRASGWMFIFTPSKYESKRKTFLLMIWLRYAIGRDISLQLKAKALEAIIDMLFQRFPSGFVKINTTNFVLVSVGNFTPRCLAMNPRGAFCETRIALSLI